MDAVDPLSLSFRHLTRAKPAAQTVAKAAISAYLRLPLSLAEALRRWGMGGAAKEFLRGVYAGYPYDFPLRAHLCDLFYESSEAQFPFGTMERGIFLLDSMERSFPSEQVTTAYFANLEELMRGRAPRTKPGRVVLGLGAGRCGTTTLAGMIASVQDAVATHENPPLVHWHSDRRQIDFHMKRFALLARYYPLVFDCSLWWINLVEQIFGEFPSAQAVGLCRETEACAQSYYQVHGGDNMWVAPHNGIWRTGRWSAVYPNFPFPKGARKDPQTAWLDLARRYVTEYNQRLHALVARYPERILLLRTEELDSQETREKISQLIGLPISGEFVRLNVESTSDSSSGELWF